MKRLQNILVPIDFTPSSYAAVEKASFLAGLYQADLTLIHVLSVLPQSFGVVKGLDMEMQSLVRKAEENARDLMRDAKKKFVPYVIKCKSVIRHGDIAHEISKEAEALGSDMIVMAAEGVSASDPIKLGSKVSEVISSAPCPVITYYKVTDFHGFKRILIPVDPQFGVWEIRKFVKEHFSIMVPEVTLLCISDPDIHPDGKKELQDFLDTEAGYFKEDGISGIKTEIRGEDGIADAINRYSHDNGCDLIVMYTHGRSGLGSMALSSVTHNVVNHSKTPVLTIRPKREFVVD